MMHYRKSTLIDAPVEVVWNFHERPDILERLTPPWQPVQVVRREGGLDVGAISEFRLFFGPIPVRWVAVHLTSSPPCLRDRVGIPIITDGVSWLYE